MLCANFDAFMAVALSWMRYKMLSKSVVDYDQRWEKNGPQGLFFPALVIINNKHRVESPNHSSGVLRFLFSPLVWSLFNLKMFSQYLSSNQMTPLLIL